MISEAVVAIDKERPSKKEIRTRRLAAGLSGAESAAIIGKAARTWRSFEAGSIRMRASDWKKYCEELDRRAESGELIVADSEWVSAGEALRLIGRSRMTLYRLVETGQVRRVKKNSQFFLYNKSDLRQARKGFTAVDSARATADDKYYTREAAAELIGGFSRLAVLREAGILIPVKTSPGVYYARDDVDNLASRIEKESAMLTISEAAKQLGLTRQGLSAMLSRMKARGDDGATPVATLLGRPKLTQEMVDKLAQLRKR